MHREGVGAFPVEGDIAKVQRLLFAVDHLVAGRSSRGAHRHRTRLHGHSRSVIACGKLEAEGFGRRATRYLFGDFQSRIARKRHAVEAIHARDRVGRIGRTDRALQALQDIGRVRRRPIGGFHLLEAEAFGHTGFHDREFGAPCQALEDHGPVGLQLQVEWGTAFDRVGSVAVVFCARFNRRRLAVGVAHGKHDAGAFGARELNRVREGDIRRSRPARAVIDELCQAQARTAHVLSLKRCAGCTRLIPAIADLVGTRFLTGFDQHGGRAVHDHGTHNLRAELPCSAVETGRFDNRKIMPGFEHLVAAVGGHRHKARRGGCSLLVGIGVVKAHRRVREPVARDVQRHFRSRTGVDVVLPELFYGKLRARKRQRVGIGQSYGPRHALGAHPRAVGCLGEGIAVVLDALGLRIVIHRSVLRGPREYLVVGHVVARRRIGRQTPAVGGLDDLRLLVGGEVVVGFQPARKLGPKVERFLAGPHAERHRVDHVVLELSCTRKVPGDPTVCVGCSGSIGPGRPVLGIGERRRVGVQGRRREFGKGIGHLHIREDDRVGDAVDDFVEGRRERGGIFGALVGAAQVLHVFGVAEGVHRIELVASTDDAVCHSFGSVEVAAVGVGVARAPHAVGVVPIVTAQAAVAEGGVAVGYEDDVGGFIGLGLGLGVCQGLRAREGGLPVGAPAGAVTVNLRDEGVLVGGPVGHAVDRAREIDHRDFDRIGVVCGVVGKKAFDERVGRRLGVRHARALLLLHKAIALAVIALQGVAHIERARPIAVGERHVGAIDQAVPVLRVVVVHGEVLLGVRRLVHRSRSIEDDDDVGVRILLRRTRTARDRKGEVVGTVPVRGKGFAHSGLGGFFGGVGCRRQQPRARKEREQRKENSRPSSQRPRKQEVNFAFHLHAPFSHGRASAHQLHNLAGRVSERSAHFPPSRWTPFVPERSPTASRGNDCGNHVSAAPSRVTGLFYHPFTFNCHMCRSTFGD